MKKIIISLLIIIFSITSFIVINNKKEEKTSLKEVKVAEVAHTIFYAPQYVALKKGYFKDEGLDIKLTLTPGADKVTSAVLSGDVQIGFCGSEASIYVYNSGKKDYIVNFAAITQRDGAFIVSRKKIKNFKLTDLKGKYVIGGRKGGMPEMMFESSLRNNNINPDELTIDTSIDFASMAGSFVSGLGDFVTLFEPSATKLENEGKGYVVDYVGKYTGTVPYTAYNAKKSFIKKNKKVIKSFTKAIDKGLKYVNNTDEVTIAKDVIDYFPDMTINELAKMIKRYKENDAWKKNTYISKKDFNNLQDVMKKSGELTKKAPYDKLIDSTYSKNE